MSTHDLIGKAEYAAFIFGSLTAFFVVTNDADAHAILPWVAWATVLAFAFRAGVLFAALAKKYLA